MPQETPTPKKPMKLKTALKAGADDGTGGGCPTWGCGSNHNQTISQSAKPKPLKLKTAIKAGLDDCGWRCGENHNQVML